MKKRFRLTYYFVLFIYWFLVGFLVLYLFIDIFFPKFYQILLLDDKEYLMSNLKWIGYVISDYIYYTGVNNSLFYKKFIDLFYGYWWLILFLLILLPVYFSFNMGKLSIRNIFLFFIYIILVILFGWVKFIYMMGNYILKSFGIRELNKIVDIVFSIILGFILFGSVIFLSYSITWGWIIAIILILNYCILVFYFTIEKSYFGLKEILLLKFINQENIEIFLKNFWKGIIVAVYFFIMFFFVLLNFIIYIDLSLVYGESIILYFGKYEILLFSLVVAVGGVGIFRAIYNILRERLKLVIVGLFIFFIIESIFIYFLSIKYYENNFPWKFYTNVSFSNMIKFIERGYISDYFINSLELDNKDRETIFKYISQKKNININRYLTEQINLTKFICGNMGVCKLGYLRSLNVNTLNDYNNFVKEIKNILEDKDSYSYYDMIVILNGHYGHKYRDNWRNLDYFYIINDNIEKKIIPNYLLYNSVSLIRCIYFPIYNNDYVSFELLKDFYEKVDKTKYTSLQTCLYKNAYLGGFSNIVDKIEYDIYKSFKKNLSIEKFKSLTLEKSERISTSLKRWIIIRDYLKDKQINGTIKGRIRIVNEKGEILTYGKDYELVISPVLGNMLYFGRLVDIVDVVDSSTNIVIRKDNIDERGNMYITGLLVPLRFSIGIKFYDEWKDYEFKKGRLDIYNFTKNKSEIDIGEVVIQVFRNKQQIKKIKPKKGYYYIVYLNKKKIKAIPKRVLKLKNGKLCRNLNSNNIDCGYYLLKSVDYMFDFDNLKYVDVKGNDVYFGKGKIFVGNKELKRKKLKKEDYDRQIIKDYFEKSF